MKIKKATDAQKRQYADTNPVHPLHGYVIVPGVFGGVKSRWTCAVEYLGEGRGEPNWEIIAPKGLHFDDGRHTILGTTQQDMLDQVCELKPCREDC